MGTLASRIVLNVKRNSFQYAAKMYGTVSPAEDLVEDESTINRVMTCVAIRQQAITRPCVDTDPRRRVTGSSWSWANLEIYLYIQGKHAYAHLNLFISPHRYGPVPLYA